MNKKYFSGLLMLLFVFAAHTGIIAQAGITSMPSFSFVNAVDGSQLDPGNLMKGSAAMVVYFDPWCDHCQEQAKWINEEISEFDNVSVLFVAFVENNEDVANFREEFLPNAVGKKNFLFAVDSQYQFDSYFGYSEAPTIFIFNNQWRLAKKLTEETPVSELKSFLK